MWFYGFPHREETAGDWPVAGDEHSVQVLVLLPQGQLQPEDVRGVQTVLSGGRQRQLQVREKFGHVSVQRPVGRAVK